MLRPPWKWLLLICVAGVACAQTVDVGPKVLTPEQYLQELSTWEHYVAAENDHTVPPPEKPALPPEWIVRTSGSDYHVSTDFLRAVDNPVEAKSALQHLRALEAAATAPIPAQVSARSTANKILHQRQFRGVHMPGYKESLIDRISAAILHFLEKVLGKAAENASGIRAFVDVLAWVLLLGGASLIFFWIIRTIREGSASDWALEGQPPEFVSSKAAEVWLSEARAAAGRGEFRLAICLAYWAAISGLENTGAWKPDRTRTPREYLRTASEAPFLPVLRSLTHDFERTWYANQTATEADFQSCLARVKDLGWQ